MAMLNNLMVYHTNDYNHGWSHHKPWHKVSASIPRRRVPRGKRGGVFGKQCGRGALWSVVPPWWSPEFGPFKGLKGHLGHGDFMGILGMGNFFPEKHRSKWTSCPRLVPCWTGPEAKGAGKGPKGLQCGYRHRHSRWSYRDVPFVRKMSDSSLTCEFSRAASRNRGKSHDCPFTGDFMGSNGFELGL